MTTTNGTEVYEAARLAHIAQEPHRSPALTAALAHARRQQPDNPHAYAVEMSRSAAHAWGSAIWRMTADHLGRIYTEPRRAQGFRSQEHLDAFYRYHDHRKTCEACQLPGEAVWVDDGWQPTRNTCDDGRALLVASFGENF